MKLCLISFDVLMMLVNLAVMINPPDNGDRLFKPLSTIWPNIIACFVIIGVIVFIGVN